VRSKRPAPGSDLDLYLKPFIVLVIVLLCGPEVFAAADLVALLDLLGAMLFLTAFAVAYKALGIVVATRIQGLFVPAEWTPLIRARGHPLIVAHGLLLAAGYALRLSLTLVASTVGVVAILRTVV
jgi:hypothetical protein